MRYRTVFAGLFQAGAWKHDTDHDAQTCCMTTKTKPETANRITANIIRVVNLTPQSVAYRINNVGVWDAAKGVHRAGNTEKGLPDVWICTRGRFVVVEVKAGKDKLSIHQEHRRAEILRAGGIWFTAHSTDGFLVFWSNLKEELEL